jgi:hypothetical protein
MPPRFPVGMPLQKSRKCAVADKRLDIQLPQVSYDPLRCLPAVGMLHVVVVSLAQGDLSDRMTTEG